MARRTLGPAKWRGVVFGDACLGMAVLPVGSSAALAAGVVARARAARLLLRRKDFLFMVESGVCQT